MSSTSMGKWKRKKSSSYSLIPSNSDELDEEAFDRLDAEWLFLTEELGRKEGLPEPTNGQRE
jgi:hypothetical protein